MAAPMADCLVRLGFALVAIVVVSAVFYEASSPRAVAIETASPLKR